jgi:hypothetical protein
MTRVFKNLSLMLFAVAFTTALAVSTASATNFTVAPLYSGSQSAKEPHVFKTDGFETTCKVATFSGELSAVSSSTATLNPVYEECTSAGLSATIEMNGCEYLLHLGEATTVATVDLVCPAGKEVRITAGFGACVTHIPPFTGKSDVKLTNVVEEGQPKIKGEATVSGIKATLTEVSSLLCAFEGNTTVTNATYTGNLTVSFDGFSFHVG